MEIRLDREKLRGALDIPVIPRKILYPVSEQIREIIVATPRQTTTSVTPVYVEPSLKIQNVPELLKRTGKVYIGAFVRGVDMGFTLRCRYHDGTTFVNIDLESRNWTGIQQHDFKWHDIDAIGAGAHWWFEVNAQFWTTATEAILSRGCLLKVICDRGWY